jgi:hypothetical protein
LRWRLHPLAAPASNLRLASAALRPARPGTNPPARIGVLSFGSTGGKRRAFAVCIALPLVRWLTFQLALASFLRLGRRPTADSHLVLILQLGTCPTSGFHRLLLQPSACASCRYDFSSLRWLSPVCHTGGELPTRIGCYAIQLYRSRFVRLASDVSTSGWAFDAPLASTEPCIAGKPSMSIPYPPVLAPSGSASLTTSDLRRLLQSLAQPAIPLRLSPQVSPSGWACGDSPTLVSFSFRMPFRQPTPNALLAIS